MGNYGTHPEKLKPVIKIRQFFDFPQEFFMLLTHVTTTSCFREDEHANSAYQFVKAVKKIAKCLISVTHENGDCNMMFVQVPIIHAEDAR